MQSSDLFSRSAPKSNFFPNDISHQDQHDEEDFIPTTSAAAAAAAGHEHNSNNFVAFIQDDPPFWKSDISPSAPSPPYHQHRSGQHQCYGKFFAPLGEDDDGEQQQPQQQHQTTPPPPHRDYQSFPLSSTAYSLSKKDLRGDSFCYNPSAREWFESGVRVEDVTQLRDLLPSAMSSASSSRASSTTSAAASGAALSSSATNGSVTVTEFLFRILSSASSSSSSGCRSATAARFPLLLTDGTEKKGHRLSAHNTPKRTPLDSGRVEVLSSSSSSSDDDDDGDDDALVSTPRTVAFKPTIAPSRNRDSRNRDSRNRDSRNGFIFVPQQVPDRLVAFVDTLAPRKIARVDESEKQQHQEQPQNQQPKRKSLEDIDTDGDDDESECDAATAIENQQQQQQQSDYLKPFNSSSHSSPSSRHLLRQSGRLRQRESTNEDDRHSAAMVAPAQRVGMSRRELQRIAQATRRRWMDEAAVVNDVPKADVSEKAVDGKRMRWE